MSKERRETIPLENLYIDIENPRYEPKSGQTEAIANIAFDQGMKLVNLAQDILEKGLNPADLPIVTETQDSDVYTVREGNRRIAALKIVQSLELLNKLGLPSNIHKHYERLNKESKDTIPPKILCSIMSDIDAKYWILLKHTGENDGVGTVNWDGAARARFVGSSPALQAIELVENQNLIDGETKDLIPKIAITNIERVLGSPEAREELGIDVQNQRLSIKKGEDEDKVLARLAYIVSDVAHKKVKVTNLDNTEQIISYAQGIVARQLSVPRRKIISQQTKKSNITTTPRVQPISTKRTSLIPKAFKLSIPQNRINRIYHELQELNTNKFLNSCAVLLRVFVELSINEYAKKKGIDLTVPVKSKTSKSGQRVNRDMTLRQKIKSTADYLEQNKIRNKADLYGIRVIAGTQDHVLSVKSLHAYVHNQNYNPSAADLRNTWDNIQLFIEGIWVSYDS